MWSRRDQNLSPLVEISTFAWLNSIPVCQKQHSCIRTKFLEGWQIKVRGPRSLRRGSWTEFRGKASRLAPPWTPNRGLLDCLRDLDRFGSRGGTYVCGACGPNRRRWWMDRGSGKKNVRVNNHKEDQMLQKMHRTGEK